MNYMGNLMERLLGLEIFALNFQITYGLKSMNF